MKNIVHFSGGKDSTAMLLMMIEKGIKIDEIIFCDTGKEFDELYEHIDKIERYIGQKVTRLKNEHSYEYFLYDKEITRGHNKGNRGYGWTKMNNRWCTKTLKTQLIDRHLRKYTEEYTRYIGIAYDEPKRIKNTPGFKYPLYEWKITEAEALQYCYDKGFDFGGLYNHFDRLGCWLCPLQKIESLYSLYKYYPDKWQELKQIEMDMYRRTKNQDLTRIVPFNGRNNTILSLDGRFKIKKLLEERQKNENGGKLT